MGWGTDFTANLYISKEIFTSEYELDNKIEEINTSINRTKAELLMYVSSNPKDITPKDWDEETIPFLYNKINEIMEQLEDDFYLLFLYNSYKETNPFKDKTKDE